MDIMNNLGKYLKSPKRRIQNRVYLTEFVLLSTALKTARKNSNHFSQYANWLKHEKLDVTINSFQSHSAIFCNVTRGDRI